MTSVSLRVDGYYTTADIRVEDPAQWTDGERAAAVTRALLLDAAERAYAALYPNLSPWHPRDRDL